MTSLQAWWTRAWRGLPPADPGVERACRAVAAVASLWFALAAGWELAGPFGAGHVAASASLGIAGENMVRWNIIAPVLRWPRLAVYFSIPVGNWQGGCAHKALWRPAWAWPHSTRCSTWKRSPVWK